MKFYSCRKYTQKTLARLYASQISYVNKQEYDTQILANFDSRKIAHVLFENLKNGVFLYVLEHAFFCKCYYTVLARNNFKYLT